MEHVLHLHEFFVEGNSPEVSHVLLNITEPSTAAEQEKGYFFAICEINNAATKYISQMQNVIDEIENNYYEIPDQPGQSAMETVLDKVNKEALSMVQPDISLHCLVGAIRQNEIIFSFYGHPQMVLFYKTKDGIYKKMDLVGQNQPNAHEEKHQLFSQIVQGKIGPNDFFFAGTPHIVEYFNHDRLQKIITTRPPRQSAEHLQRVLAELKNDTSFGGIIINLQEAAEGGQPAPKTSPIKKGDSARSLKNLFSTEKKTAHILSSSLLPKFQEKLNTTLNKVEYETEMMAPNKIDNRANTDISSAHLRARHARTKIKPGISAQEIFKKTFKIIWTALRYAGKGLFLLFLFIGTIISTLARNLLLIFFVITNYQNRRQNIIISWTRWWKNFTENLRHLPLVTKILLSLSIILVLAFGAGIVYLRTKQIKTARSQAYLAALQDIKIKEDAAESSLVYNDNVAALTILKEAEEKIKNLPCVSASEKTNCQNLQSRLDELFSKARKITLTQPQLLADWNGLAKNAQINNIFLLNNKIYGFGQTSADILTYDPLTKESALVSPGIFVQKFNAASVPKENDYAVLLYDDKNIVQFNPKDSSWKKVDISYPNQNASIANVFVYNRRLYSLDTENSHIYKHDPIASGFSLGKPWTKNNNTDLKLGTDLTIDGDVFVLGNNGAIYKFTNGQNQPFTLSGLDPELTSAIKIWTYNDLNYIYILDAEGKRILITDKNGQLKNQITAKEFNHPTGIIIDEPKNTAYVLDSNRLYQINLQ